MFKIKYEPFLTRYHLFKLNQVCVHLGILWANFRVVKYPYENFEDECLLNEDNNTLGYKKSQGPCSM